MSEHPFSQFIQAFSTPSLFHIWSWALCRYPAKLWTGFSAAWAEPAVRDLTPTMLWQHITLTLIHLCWLLLKWNISFECPFALSTFFLNLFSVLYLSDLSHSHYVCGPPRWGPAHHFPLKSADHVGHSLCGGWVLCSTCSPWLVLFPLFTSSINTSIYIKW